MIPVPTSFWRGFAASKPVHQEWDWLAGDFEFKVIAPDTKSDWGIIGRGAAIGLAVDPNRLPHVLWSLPNGDQEGQAALSNGQRCGGRPAGKWWPDFLDELTRSLH